MHTSFWHCMIMQTASICRCCCYRKAHSSDRISDDLADGFEERISKLWRAIAGISVQMRSRLYIFG
jgi:hypothetical protein